MKEIATKIINSVGMSMGYTGEGEIQTVCTIDNQEVAKRRHTYILSYHY